MPAAMYTLLGSAKLNGLDPKFYLRTVLARNANHPINQIYELLPWNLALPHSRPTLRRLLRIGLTVRLRARSIHRQIVKRCF